MYPEEISVIFASKPFAKAVYFALVFMANQKFVEGRHLCIRKQKPIEDMENNQYRRRTDFGRVSVVQNRENQYAVIDAEGSEIVPFGKYSWIDGFDSGLARVRTAGVRYNDPNVCAVFDDEFKVIQGDALAAYYDDLKRNHPEQLARWGIINMEGEEVLPASYDNIWNFYGKSRRSTTVENDGSSWNVEFSCLLGSAYYREELEEDDTYDDYDDYGTHYGEYAGSYAQDVMGYSDDVIDDVFEGDPDAYWNID